MAKQPKPSSSYQKQTTSYSKSADGSTRTTYPKKTSSSGTVTQMTRTTKPMLKKK